MDSKGFYKTLGVPENASDDDIKKAYRKLCVKWHPDKWVNGTDEEKKKAEEEFKKVGEAYSVLSDPEKRQQYDSGVESNFGRGDDIDPFEVFRRASAHFNNPFFGGFGQQQRPSGHPGTDIDEFITLSFRETLNTIKKDVVVEKSVPCPDCNGTGSKDGQEHQCQYCKGTGMETRTERRGNVFNVYQQPCQHCHGTGKEITTPCEKCNGSGYIGKQETIQLDIPAGVRDGIVVAYSGLGNAGTPGYPNGNLNLHIKVKADIPGYFKISPNSNDILHEETVDLIDALLGKKITVKCPDGSDWQVNLHECTQPGEKYTKSGGGYKPNGQWGPQTNGNYIIKINYNVPTKLTKKQKKILEDFKNEK